MTDYSKTMCIPIHGTFNSKANWYQPGSEMWRHLKEVFPNDFFTEDDPFDWWPATASSVSRWAGGDKLFQYCDRYHHEHGYEKFRLIGHSHGASVACICTHRMAEHLECEEEDGDIGWSVKQLVCLAPYVGRRFPADHQPNLDFVDEKKFYNFHAEWDPIVPRFSQNHRAFPTLRDFEDEFVFDNKFGHWKPIRAKIWKRYKLGNRLN